MAWFRKERKPRQPRREKLEIPPDAWEKCEACGHTDLREKFIRNLNVCPNCDFHRRIRAVDYVNLLLDDNSYDELDVDIRSVDPLSFPEYPARLKKALANAGDYDALMSVSGNLGGMPINLGVMDFAFMGGSMGSVVGAKIARLGQRSLERKYPLVLVSASGGARKNHLALQPANAFGLRRHVGEAHTEFVIDHHHFALCNEAAVDQHIHRLACERIELDHRALCELEDVFDWNPGASQFDGELYRNVEYQVDIVVHLAAIAGEALEDRRLGCGRCVSQCGRCNFAALLGHGGRPIVGGCRCFQLLRHVMLQQDYLPEMWSEIR